MRPGIPAQLVGRPRSADPCEDGDPRLARPRGVLSHASYRARLREATRTDWRFLLGLTPDDVVIMDGPCDALLASALAPWVGAIRGNSAIASTSGPAKHGLADWVWLGAVDAQCGLEECVRAGLAKLKAGGHLAAALENPHGLHWLADWRPSAAEREGPRRSLPVTLSRFERAALQAGAAEICSFALLPHHEAPRAVVPIEPAAALTRKLLGLALRLGLMRRLYPHYLVVVRKPC